MGFRMELVQGATPICEGSCHLTPLRGTSCWNDCKSCKVRVGSNGNSLWEASVLLGRKKGCVMETLKFAAMPFGLTNTPAVFMELMSKLLNCGVGKRVKPSISLDCRYDDSTKIKKGCWCYKITRPKQRTLSHEWLAWLWTNECEKRWRMWFYLVRTKVQILVWRDVRTLAIEEAYTIKYPIHPGADAT
ncbi:hypothetical protein Tco_1274069 [Tanacetum coccineum]